MILAAKLHGTLWAWGYNSVGQLGNGTTTNSAAPVQTSNLSGITGSVTTTYQYDENGLWMHKTTGGVTSNLAWDYSEGLPLLLTDGSTLYVYGLGGLPIEPVDSKANVLYLHADQLGSTQVLTDPTGAVVGTFTYDAYGKLARRPGRRGPRSSTRGSTWMARQGITTCGPGSMIRGPASL